MSATRLRRLHGPPGLLVALVLGTGAGACFNAPGAAVMFACDPAGEAACPDGYTCEADGCCHREGGDVEANAGMCHVNLGGTGAPTSTGATEATGSSGPGATDVGSSTGGTSETGTGTGETGGTSTGATGTDGTGGTSTGATGGGSTGESSSTGGTTG